MSPIAALYYLLCAILLLLLGWNFLKEKKSGDNLVLTLLVMIPLLLRLLRIK